MDFFVDIGYPVRSFRMTFLLFDLLVVLLFFLLLLLTIVAFSFDVLISPFSFDFFDENNFENNTHVYSSIFNP